jgi:thioredoxin-like negative regulator of GroEL
MTLSWISQSRKVADVDSLVARGRFARALKVLRAQLRGRQPTLAQRLRHADLLVLAGRADEALPILLGLADKQARYGFRDKAIEALRRAQEIDPRHPGVRHRLEALRSAAPSDRLSGPFAPRSCDDRAGCAQPEATGGDEFQDDDEPSGPEDEPEPETGFELLEEEREPSAAEPLPLVFELLEEARKPSEAEPLRVEADRDEGDTKRPDDAVTSSCDEASLHQFLLGLGCTQGTGPAALGPALFADFPREAVARVAAGVQRRRFAPGDVLVTEGDPGASLFLIARGSVRVLVLGGHGRPFDVRRLDAGDFFGELAVLSGWPRTATVVAAAPCETLEIGPEALETLLALRPRAHEVLEETAASRAHSPEEQAVRSLPPEAADPERAAEALRTHFGGSEWSHRVRLHLAQLMLDVGRREEALAILASVAEDLARNGRAQKAIAVLKNVEWIRRRGAPEVRVATVRRGRRRSSRLRREAPSDSSASAPPSPAANGASFREWVGSMLRVTHALAARPASSASRAAAASEDHLARGTA